MAFLHSSNNINKLVLARLPSLFWQGCQDCQDCQDSVLGGFGNLAWGECLLQICSAGQLQASLMSNY
jgi:hypothetical protein